MKRLVAICLFLVLSQSIAGSVSDLQPDEQNTVAIFQKYAPNVVYVHRLKRAMNANFELFDMAAGAGSGIIWDRDGHIVTNFHVIQGSHKIAVSLGELTVEAQLIGAEPRKDIAVLKLKSKAALTKLNAIQSLKIASSEDLLVGQKAIAIGNPFGLDHSLTVGVISALGRKVPGVGGVSIRDMIQTDASINPGNSGGPLLNSNGELMGMNTVIYSNSGSSAGVGFAVPADDLKRVVEQIIKHGRVVLAGIGFERVEPNIARQLGVDKGVLISRVIDNTPADTIGLKGTYRDAQGFIHLGDVITAINGHPTDNYDDLYNLLSEMPVDKKITLTVLRHDKPLHFTIKTIDIASYQ